MNSIKKLLISTLLFGFLASSALADLQIVTVNMQRLFDGYYRAAERISQLDSLQEQAVAESEQRQRRLQEKVEEVQEFEEDLENPMLSDSAREQQQMELQGMYDEARQMQFEYQQWEQQTMQQIQARGQQVRQELIDEIREVVDVIARDEGARMIMDTSDIFGTGVPTVLWADPRLDVTGRVLRELNRDAPEND